MYIIVAKWFTEKKKTEIKQKIKTRHNLNNMTSEINESRKLYDRKKRSHY